MGAFVLLTAGGGDPGGQIEATHVFERLMLLLLSEGFWPHGVRGAERALEPSDVVLFGLVERGETQIVGDAVVGAGSLPLTPQRLGQVRMYLGPMLPGDPSTFTHSVVLTQLNLRGEPWACQADGPFPGQAVATAVGPETATGAVLPVEAAAYEAITGRGVPEEPVRHREPEALPAEPASAAPHDHALRDLVLGNPSLVDLGVRLRLPARKDVPTPAGTIDLLGETEDGREVLAVMWANGDPPADVLAAAHARLAWLREDLAVHGHHVRGLVLALDGSEALAAGSDGELEVRRVRVLCEPLEPPRAPGFRASPGVARPSEAPPRVASEAPGSSVDLDFAAKCLRVPRVRA